MLLSAKSETLAILSWLELANQGTSQTLLHTGIYRSPINAADMISPKIFGIGIVAAFVAGSFVAFPELRTLQRTP
jgi:hypothetical protein